MFSLYVMYDVGRKKSEANILFLFSFFITGYLQNLSLESTTSSVLSQVFLGKGISFYLQFQIFNAGLFSSFISLTIFILLFSVLFFKIDQL